MADQTKVDSTRSARPYGPVGGAIVARGVLALGVACAAANHAAAQSPSPPLRIGTIEIVSHGVFEVPSSGLAPPYRIANGIAMAPRGRVGRPAPRPMTSRKGARARGDMVFTCLSLRVAGLSDLC